MLFRAITVGQKTPRRTHKAPDDKRAMWGALRGDGPDDTILSSLNDALEAGPYAFDNSMETSIRGINFITKLIIANKRSEIGDTVAKKFIKACYCHCLLCPDLYVKRKRFSISEESNNHRFYNLLFLLYYSLFLSKPLKTAKLEKFVTDRLEADLFYDEGSSFYHYGVVYSLIEFDRLVRKIKGEDAFSLEFGLWLTRAGKYQEAFKALNFGDRDGTLVSGGRAEATECSRGPLPEFFCRRFYLRDIGEELWFVRGENWCDKGTNGHAHDDFGQVIIKTQQARILDPGIHLYREEPSLCRRRHHNYPRCVQHQEMGYRAKFERTPARDVAVERRGSIIYLTRSQRDITVVREFDVRDGSFVDRIENHSKDVSYFEWTFYIEVMAKPKSSAIRVSDNTAEVNKLGSLIFAEDASVSLECASYYPCYAERRPCYRVMASVSLNSRHVTTAKFIRAADSRYKEMN